MTYEILISIGQTLDFIGKLLVSYTAISVHQRVWKEHKIDEAVFSEMKRERILGFAGIVLMSLGFFFEVFPRFFL